MAKCLVRGSINADEYFRVKAIARPGETISSYDFQTKPGGKGANQAVAIARAGGDVDFVGAVGPGGQWLVDELISHRVGVGGVVRVEEPTGRALIQVAEDGENSIVLHHGANHANLQPPRASTFTVVTHLLLQNEIPLKSTIEYLSLAHSQNLVSIMNPSPTPSREDIRTFPWQKLSWLIVNEGEAASLLSALVSDNSITMSATVTQDHLPSDWPQGENPSLVNTYRVASQLARKTSFASQVNIICTLGPLGVMAFIHSLTEPIYLPAAKLRGPVIDTTGAGDCFAGYLAVGLMNLHQKRSKELEIDTAAHVGEVLTKDDIVWILERCVQAAGMCVQRRGTIDSIPTKEEVDAELKG